MAVDAFTQTALAVVVLIAGLVVYVVQRTRAETPAVTNWGARESGCYAVNKNSPCSRCHTDADMAVVSQGYRAVAYRRRCPEQTTLYQVVQQHLEIYLALAGEDDWDGQRVPAYVEREFRRYLECGMLA